MIRPELMNRENSSLIQKNFLEFHTALCRVIDSAALSFETGSRSGLLQSARQADILQELGEDFCQKWDPDDDLDRSCRTQLSCMALRAAAVLRSLCTVGASPLEGFEESRSFLGSLCRRVSDRLDWSVRSQLLGPRYGDAAGEEDIELTLSELPLSLVGEKRLSRVESLLDFRDCLRAASDLFEIVGEVRRMADKLFPVGK